MQRTYTDIVDIARIQGLNQTLSRRLNRTHVEWDGESTFTCLIYNHEWQTVFVFATCRRMELADELCARRQGWTLTSYYAAIRADMATGGW